MLRDYSSRELDSRQPPSRLEMEARALLIADRLLAGHHVKRVTAATPGGLAPWQVRRTTEYLRAHLHAEVSLGTLANLVSLSPFHFARAFKQSMGSPPHAFHCALRLEEAKKLLAETEMSITQVALAIGYEAPQTLARVFRRELGTTPTSFRNEHRK